MSSPLAATPCRRCKVKKSKCDRTVPSCKRCLKAGQICSGYAEAGSTVFRAMNDYAEQKVKARLIRRSRANNGPSDQDSTAASPILPLSDSRQQTPTAALVQIQPAKIQPPMVTNWHDVAVPRFFDDYIWPSHLVPGGSLNFVPEILDKYPQAVFVKSAMQAVALISLANQTHQPYLARDAEYFFLNAIAGVAKALEDVETAKSDAVMASTFLFSVYGMLIDVPAHKFWNVHHQRGQVSLLKLRGESQFSTETARNLYKMNHTQLMVTCLAAHLPPPDEAERWLELLGPDNPASELGWCNLLSARVCAKVQSLFDDPCQDDGWMLRILQQIKEILVIDERFQYWLDTSLIGNWSQKQVRVANAKVEDLPIYVYHDLIVGFTWNYYRAARIHINEIMRRCIQLVQSHPSSHDLGMDLEEVYLESTTTINDMVTGVRCSTEFCLGDIDSNGKEGGRRMPLAGRAMIWPLYRASRSCEEGSELQLWFVKRLDFISEVMGNRLAKRLAARPWRYPWDIR